MLSGLNIYEIVGAAVLLAAVLWVERRAWAGIARWRRRTVLICRATEVLLVFLAFSGLRWERRGNETAVLFALDVSSSMPEEARREAVDKITASVRSMRASDRAGLLVFGREPLVEAMPQSRLRIGELQSRPDQNFTDLAAALRLATGLFPEGVRRRLVLFSDGNENRGDALNSLRDVQSAGVSIDVFPIETPPRNEVILTGLELPARVEVDEPFTLRVGALATQAGPATLRFFRDSASIGRKEVELDEGRNQFELTYSEDAPGFHTYEAIIESTTDVRPENNIAGAYTQVAGPSRVLVVGTEEDNSALANALELSRVDFETAPGLPGNLLGLQAFDAVMLNNVPATDFSPRQLEELERYVRDLGGGLTMIGGENSFAPGGWLGTPVERVLPVRMELKTKERFPSLALVMVIDKSGSMGGIGTAVSKMELAGQAAVEAVNLLGPRDQVGVVAFDSVGKWVVPIGPAEIKDEIISNIRSMAPGGGTNAYTGAVLAAEALAQADAQLKHIILLSDGQTEAGDFDSLLTQMNEAGITLSAIAIGADADRFFLDNIARQGRGRFYYCPDPSRVPRIFVRETILVQRSYIVEETVAPEQAAVHPILDDAALGSMPPLHGYVVTEIKERAEPVLQVRGEDPLLSVWQTGLGTTVAFTSDVQPRWARDWTAWGGFQSFWDRVARWTLRSVASTDLHPQIGFDRGQGKLRIEAADIAGERLNFLDLNARVLLPDLEVVELPLRQTAIGVYEAEFDADAPGAYLAEIVGADGRRATAGGMVAFSPEFKDFESNDYLLYELARRTGGKVNPRVEEIFRREGRPMRASREVAPQLLTLALILLLIEVGVRRLYFDEEQVAAFRAALERVVPFRLARAGGPPDPDLGISSDLKTRAQSIKATLRRTAEAGAAQKAGRAGSEPGEAATEPSTKPKASSQADQSKRPETLRTLKRKRSDGARDKQSPPAEKEPKPEAKASAPEPPEQNAAPQAATPSSPEERRAAMQKLLKKKRKRWQDD